MTTSKLQGYLGICKKANYLIIGGDTLKVYSKKLYLIVVNSQMSKTIEKIINYRYEQGKVKVIALKENNLTQLLGLNNCQIVGIKNKGLADAICNNCTEDYNIIRGE